MKPWISSSGGPDPACQYRQVTPSMVTLHSSAPAIRATVGTMGSVSNPCVVAISCMMCNQPAAQRIL